MPRLQLLLFLNYSGKTKRVGKIKCPPPPTVANPSSDNFGKCYVPEHSALPPQKKPKKIIIVKANVHKNAFFIRILFLILYL